MCLHTSTLRLPTEILMLPPLGACHTHSNTDCETVNGWGVGFKAQEPLHFDPAQPQVLLPSISSDHGVTETKEALL